MPGEPRYYINDTGTGNTVNTSHPKVLRLVLDLLRYWAEEMHVDGFRFDLGTILGREPHGFDPRGGFFDAVGQDPVLNRIKLVGEPWDIGPGGYQVGSFPPAGPSGTTKYRDTVRGYWKGDEGLMQDFAARVTGSGDVYDQRGRRPWAGVNFVTAHDGFNPDDLVSYNEKHNEANGEDNQDGHNDNRSYNYGAGGADRGCRRARGARAAEAEFPGEPVLLHGTPMLLAVARVSAAARAATTTAIARTTRSPGSIGGDRRGGRRAHRFRPPCRRAAPRTADPAADQFSATGWW